MPDAIESIPELPTPLPEHAQSPDVDWQHAEETAGHDQSQDVDWQHAEETAGHERPQDVPDESTGRAPGPDIRD